MDQKAIDAAKATLIGHFPDFKSFEDGGEEYKDREDTYKREGLKEFQRQMSPYVQGSSQFNADEDVKAIVDPLFKLTNFVNWRDIRYINDTLFSSHGAWIDFIQPMLACLKGASTNQWEKPLEDVLSFLAMRNCNANITKLLPTFFLFNWDSHHHIFIKPRVCLKFLRRLGEGVGKAGQAMSVDEYRRILGVFERLKQLLADWKPRDFVDLQSFYYIVEGYGDPEEEEMDEVKSHSEKSPLASGPETLRDSPINLILYGPPGTGKTYHIIERAVKVIVPNFAGTRVEYKARFDELLRLGRIGFVTFHQSYSYEDFVEGIRPVIDENADDDSVRYECRAGIFKRLSVTALFDSLESSDSGSPAPKFQGLWEGFLAEIEASPDKEYEGLSDRTRYTLSITSRGNIRGVNKASTKRDDPYQTSRKIVEHIYSVRRDQKSVSAADVRQTLGKDSQSQFDAAVINALKGFEKSRFSGTAAKPKEVGYTYDDKARAVQRFLSSGQAAGYRLKSVVDCPKYVLVVDEINRGNISKIFGELITLLEADKRSPGENSLVATLPYSGDYFAIPANLSLLATMNTADKSIALVDLALRRRFEFEELSVDLAICKGLNEQMRFVLTALNRRILVRKDRDHLIGHAYFIGVVDEESFNSVFRKKIIPLLQEYFYNDWDGLRYVLAEPTSGKTGFIRRVEGSDVSGARSKWQWFFDVPVNLNCLEILVGNYNNKSAPTAEVMS